MPLSEIFVTNSLDLARHAEKQNQLVVTLDDSSMRLWLEKGARDLSQFLKPAWDEITGPPTALTSVLPELVDVLKKDSVDKVVCQVVSGLALVMDGISDPVPCLMWENALLLDLAQMERMSRSERLGRLLREISGAGWLRDDPTEALKTLCDSNVEARRAEVAACETLPERLLLAVGGRVPPLRVELPDISDKSFLDSCEPLEIAGLVLALLGPAALARLSETLQEEGLKPPIRWNTAEARDFVGYGCGEHSTNRAKIVARGEAGNVKNPVIATCCLAYGYK